jgi:hypothetical protein
MLASVWCRFYYHVLILTETILHEIVHTSSLQFKIKERDWKENMYFSKT